MKKLKALHKSEVDKAGQDFSEEQEHLNLQIAKDQELLKEADTKLESANAELVQLRERRDNCTKELTRFHSHISHKFPEGDVIASNVVTKFRQQRVTHPLMGKLHR